MKMNKKGIISILIQPQVIIGIVVIVGIFLLYQYFKPEPYTLCTENYGATDNYIKAYNIEVGKRWKQENKVCYETYDSEVYGNLIKFANEQEYKKFKDRLDLEDKTNQRRWQFLEKNKLYIFGGVILIFIFLIYMKYKKK